MKHDFVSLEKRRLSRLAREYRNLGYTVIVPPLQEQLPDFLVGFQPDLLAHNEQEHVVCIVRSQQTLAISPELAGIAKAVQGKNRWRFELVVTNPRKKAK